MVTDVGLERWINNKEQSISKQILEHVYPFAADMKNDFDAVSELFPYWGLNSPKQRGNKPTGEACPFAEVGEKSVGHRILSILYQKLNCSYKALPHGPDGRLWSDNYNVFLAIDFKTIGPNDNSDEIVPESTQISGDGKIVKLNNGLKFYDNNIVSIKTPTKLKQWKPELQPSYTFRNTNYLTITIFVIINYDVISFGNQPLLSIEFVVVPNGRLLFGTNMHQTDGLILAGKDNHRIRIRLDELSLIDKWRCTQITYNKSKTSIDYR